MSESKPKKFCDDCRFYRVSPFGAELNQCLAPRGREIAGARSLAEPRNAQQMRQWRDECGDDARWFEPHNRARPALSADWLFHPMITLPVIAAGAALIAVARFVQ